MIRKVISIIFLVLAGWMLSISLIFSWIKMPGLGAKLFMLGIYAVMVIILCLIGMAFTGFKNVKKLTGLVFIWGTLVSLFTVLSVCCLYSSPELIQNNPELQKVDFKIDIVSGLSLNIICGLAGWLMYRNSCFEKKKLEVKTGQ